MKFLTLVLISALTIVSLENSASAAMKKGGGGRVGPAGCGLGYMILGGRDLQWLAATINGTSGNQTFGITTGTLECQSGSRDVMMLNYIQNNKVALEKDIARGQGESLGALAQVTGCANAPVLGTELKSHYQDIFPQNEPSAAQITDSIKHVIQTNPELASSCGVMI